MKALTILEAGKVLAIDEGEKNIHVVLGRFRNGKSVILINDSEDACIMYDSLDVGNIWSAHVLSKKSFRGKKLWEFAWQTTLWMMDHRMMETMLMFVEKDDRRMKIALAVNGIKEVMPLGKHHLFALDMEQMENFATKR